MRRSVPLLLMLLSLAVLPLTASAHGGTVVTVRGHPHRDGPLEVEGEEFAPNDVVRIELRRGDAEPFELGQVQADADGAFSHTFHVPATVEPGFYELAAEGEESASTEATILATPEGGAPAIEPEPSPAEPVSNDRPAPEVIGLAVFTAGIAVLAVGLLWISRTRPRATSA